jgi:hypothetical protein
VEGYGEDGAVRDLLWRTWTEIVGGEHAEILRPIRRSRGKFLKASEEDVEKAVGLAALKMKQENVENGLILILVDAEDDCAKLGSLADSGGEEEGGMVVGEGADASLGMGFGAEEGVVPEEGVAGARGLFRGAAPGI